MAVFHNELGATYPAREPSAGDLLLAAPGMDDPIFGRSVIYLIEFTVDSVIGVMLTRPGSTRVTELLRNWESITAEPRTFFYGGPVQREAGIALGVARRGRIVDDSTYVRNLESRVYVIDLDHNDPKSLGEPLEGIRIFAGYSSWAPGQLKGEIRNGDWLVLPSLPSDVVVGPGVDLWAEVLRRQDMPLRLYATYPDEIELN